ncbi:glycosyltransferase [Sulfurisoma sediminicola]|uniref:UDP:flavonoid glycosyltransferase YjiC (YdhE family) n=1 Tax=Sulfurisoma sediminicola TaxID=1381557 RepID=A0A497XM51_9PROT|nr:nucleotide disphospho-sugar-binding domain-containing protein [Sulfurisoma sediminicola]RLJ68480.1 UDP:flavonoid glycosyltransferase YjiC (YdhE family) [Sulfurisoma sediminicola]
MSLSVFYGWEFGENLGHIGCFLPLARVLRETGHTVHWTVASSTSAARLLDREGFAWLPAPQCPEKPRQGPPLTYADILLRFGYADASDLLGLTVAWRELMKLTGAQVVLADHAPTAQLAARTLDVPTVIFGSGFYVPPRQIPTPNMRPWIPLPPEQLAAIERPALASVNAVMERFGKPPLDGIAQLFDVAEDTLLGFPELDHYAERGPARYWGNLPDAGVGEPAPWPAVPGKRLFAYLRAGCRHHEAALAALHALGQPTVVFFPGAPEALLARFAAPHMAFVRNPLDLARTGKEADAAITYGSLSTTSRFLLAGKPLLLLPGHLEQFLMARRVEQMGAGLLVDPEMPASDLPQKLQQVVFDPFFAGNAQAFARKYAAFPQEVVIGNLVRRIEEICS